MTAEQRERARRLIETAAGAKEKSAAGIRKFQQRRDNEVADEREADAAALRAVLELLEAEPVGYAVRVPKPGVTGRRAMLHFDDRATAEAYVTAVQGRDFSGAEAFEVVALVPVRKGGES